MIELKNSRIQYLGKASGGERYSLDAFIGAVQMREPGGQWEDIKPRLVRDTDGWHIEGAPYYAEIKDDGSRLFCDDRNERGKYLHVPAPALFDNLPRNIVSSPARLDGVIVPNQITMPAEWGEMRIIFSNTGMHFEILFTKAPPPALFGKDSPRILLDVETTGIDVAELLKSGEGLAIPRPRIMPAGADVFLSQSQERWLDWSYKNGQLELGFDLSGLAFPILLKNTTVDVQIGVGADDGFCSGTDFDNTTNSIFAGKYPVNSNCRAFYRFTNITVPQSSTITVCYLTVYEQESDSSALTKLFLEKAQNPGAVTSASDYDSRTLTTAGVDWDGDPGTSDWQNSPSLVTPMQELVNAYDHNNHAMQVMHKDDGGGTWACQRFFSYDWGSSRSAKLHIEYTSGGGATAKTSAETGDGADVSLLKATLQRAEAASGTDARQSLLAVLLRSESGTGVEQSLLNAPVAKLSAESGTGLETRNLMARLTSGEAGHGVDTGAIPGQKNISGEDSGLGDDALKALLESPGAVADMKLPGRQGHVRIPSKGVSL